MSYLFLCFGVFLCTYTLNLLYISVFYHRAITHNAIVLHPLLLKFVLLTGNWVTGLDPKGWSAMHRMHHLYSDTPKDPHSPDIHGVAAVFLMQLRSYKTILAGLILGKKSYAKIVSDLKFPVSWLNKHGLWILPYLLQLGIAGLIGYYFQAWLLAACYFVGMMSHPVQGWMVNALAHRYGYRNFETPDHSRNNTVVALLVFGEGYQNNHHEFPNRAKFSVKNNEWDLGFGLIQILKSLNLLK